MTPEGASRWRSPTRARASPRTSCRGSSIHSSPPSRSASAPGSASPSAIASSPPSAARSRWRAKWASVPASSSSSLPWNKPRCVPRLDAQSLLATASLVQMPADFLAVRDALPPDLYRRPSYRIVRRFFSLGRAYYVYAEDGTLALFVRHPLLSLRERLLLYADEDETVPVLEVRARQLVSLYRCHDVLDASTGVRLGSVRTRGLSFLFRDAWDIL